MNSIEPDRASAAKADSDKSRVALSSVFAAVLLAGLKLAVGLSTGSLGILAEALHSALDLAAALMTYIAVRIAAAPPDDSHHYGHGKIESVSALFETLLLVVTCMWIIYEGVQRLVFKVVEIDPSVWAFLVMIVSILVDYSRSRALMRAAKRYQSQALEADALHFSTDIWSSAVVILGLGLVKIGERTGYESVLMRADAVAALCVAGIVLWVSVRLGRKTIAVLMDKAPAGLSLQIAEEALNVPGVVKCLRVRVRPVGPILFADLVIGIPRATPLEKAHTIASRVEERVRRLKPRVDVVVHFEPVEPGNEAGTTRIQSIAGRLGLVVHDVRIHDLGESKTATLHLEVDPNLRLAQAHEIADRLESEIRLQMEWISEVKTHIEPGTIEEMSGEPAPQLTEEVVRHLREIAVEIPALRHLSDISVHRMEGRLFVSLSCVFDAKLKIHDVHRLSSEIEQRLKARMPDIEHAHVHVEPP